MVEGYHVTSSYTALLQKGQREHPTISPEMHALACQEDASQVELAVEVDFRFWLTELDVPVEVQPGEQPVLVLHADGSRSVIIERDVDVVTKEEKVRFKAEISAARLDELTRCISLSAFHRRARLGSSNRIDVTWVDKWK